MSRHMSRRMSRHMSKRMKQRENHHGFVLLAVLVVVAAAILVATGGIFAARATTMNARAAASEQQLRDAALDGVAMAADRIASHRREILRGASPTLDTALFTRGEGLSRIEVTLEALASGEFFESESAKLDFNTDEERAVPRSAVLGCASCSCVRACVRGRGRAFRLPRGVLLLPAMCHVVDRWTSLA